MLARFSPLGVREPEFAVEESRRAREPLSTAALTARGLTGAVLCGVGSFLLVALLAALKAMRDTPAVGFDFGAAVRQVGNPASMTDWVQLIGIFAFAAIGGLFVAAAVAARRVAPVAFSNEVSRQEL
jgi:hypothetical protein